MAWGLNPDWKVALPFAGSAVALLLAPVGSFIWWLGWGLLAFAIFWLASVLTLDGEAWWRTFRKTAVALGLFSVAAVGLVAHAQFRNRNPTIADLSITFVPEQVDAERLVGRVVVRSSAERPINITHVRIASSSAVASGGKPTEVRLGQPASFPFEQYFWRGGSISFEGHFLVNGEPAKDAILAEFVVAPHPQLGDPVEPNECCKGAKSDFAALEKQDADLAANGPEGCLPVYPSDRRSDGSWDRVRDIHARRVMIFDPVGRIAAMGSFMRGNWYWIDIPLEQTVGGAHQLRYCWHEKNGYMAIEADGNYAKFDADIGKIERGELR